MLNKKAEFLINEFTSAIATTMGTENPSRMFSITVPVETKLRDAMLEKVEFLKLISVLPMSQVVGQVVDVATSDLFTGRTDTGRFTREIGVGGNTYTLVATDSCATISWEKLSQWANSVGAGEFSRLINAAMVSHFARDVLRIGFHGKSVAKATDPIANPMGQDVNKGWLQQAKEKAPAQVLAKAIIDPTGKTADSHKNLDALATDVRNSMIAEQFAEDADLVVLVGRDLVASEQARLMSEANTPVENLAAQKLGTSIGGMTAYIPPFFPKSGFWITSLKNLQVLDQTGTQRRVSRQNDDHARFESGWWRMEGYALGNLEKFAAIEAVEIASEEAPPAG